MNIMIVEDETRALRGLSKLVQMCGDQYRIVGEALDGKEALALIRAVQPDLVLTDIRMPVIDGLSMIKAAHAQGLYPQFVIISAYQDFNYARQAISLGVVDYLVKPLIKDDIKALLDKLSQQIGRRAVTVDPKDDLFQLHPDVHPLIRRALDIIDKSFACRLAQKDVAKSLGLTPEYFSYLFSQNMGVNYVKFLRLYRIKKAKEFLSQGESKEKVAEKVGFSDYKYFCKCFKEESGESVNSFLNRLGP